MPRGGGINFEIICRSKGEYGNPNRSAAKQLFILQVNEETGMRKAVLICANCGNQVPLARRCSKCGANLHVNAEEKHNKKDDLVNSAEEAELQVRIVRSVSLEEEEIWKHIDDPLVKALNSNRRYHLEIRDPTGRYQDKKIFLADLGKLPGGITLSGWKITERGKHKVLSVSLIMNMIGHDLDQRKEYDLDNGEELVSSVASKDRKS